MASTRREKELARLRAERQAARRAEEAARRRRRASVVASTLAVLLVAGVVALISLRGGDDETDPVASPSPSASAAEGPCTYTPEGDPSRPVEPPPATPTSTGPVTATMTTDQGVIAFTLDAAGAPCATESFVSLARQGFYDDTTCHRLTTEGIFVLQCGDPDGTGAGGPGYRYAEEALDGATYPRGTVAMAKTAEPGTTGSQFFLVYRDTDLPPEYTPVGTITSGIEVLEKVAAAGSEPAGDGAPKLPVRIQTFTTAPA